MEECTILKLNRDNLTFRFMSATILVIIVVMGIKFFWDYRQQQTQAMREMKEKAAVITKQQMATWEFMSVNQDNINYDSEGNFEFKHMNCSTVAMGIGVYFSQLTDYQLKPTNIVYRSVLNAPDTFELAGLQQFVADPDLAEYWNTDMIEGKEVFRYMAPLKINESCLSCHGEPAGEIDITGFAKEGFKIGDSGGALSLIMPMDIFLENKKTNLLTNAFFFFLLIAVCIVSIYVLVTRLVTSSLGQLEKAVSEIGNGNLDVNLDDVRAEGEIKQLASHFQHMIVQLRDLYTNLELKVENRTIELEKANEILKKHQTELEDANTRLKEVNTYKSEFLAIMSHELRTPLTSVIAFTELLLGKKNIDSAVERHYLEEIRTNSEILLRIINNILDLAKIEANKSDIVLQTMDMAEVICSVESVILPLARSKGIHISFVKSPEVPLFKADPEKIRRIVENLAGNAVKFTDTGGTVKVAVDYDRHKNEVLIIVEDTGIGIKEEDFEYIFERFTQSDSSLSRKYGGTGLGLALIKELVELHDGWITVQSKLNEGSTFTVGIPARDVSTDETDNR